MAERIENIDEGGVPEDAGMDKVVLYGILGFMLFENLVEIYLSSRQVKVYQTSQKVPKQLENSITQETFEKARVYGLDKENYSIFKTILAGCIIVPLELYFGFIAYIWAQSEVFAGKVHLDAKNEIYVSCVFTLVMNLVSLVKDMPFKIYELFVLEEKHGFNKQTAAFFIKDQLKALAVSQILTIPLTAAVVFIVQRGGEYFFLWLWAFTALVVLFLITLYPVVIAPLFDKFYPLEEGELRESIEKLAASLKFPLTKLYVVEGSKRSSHSNAYFYGFWKSKRIVLFDTLLLNKGKKDDSELSEDEKGKGCTNEEILAVLGHELGHWKLGHMLKNTVIIQVHLFLMFAAFSYLFKYDPFYSAIGFPHGQKPILVGLFIILVYVLGAYNAVINFAMTILSRRFEYQADEFAKNLGYAKQLKLALIKLNIDNLGFPVYDWMYSAWNHSHPTLLQRLSRLDDNKKEK